MHLQTYSTRCDMLVFPSSHPRQSSGNNTLIVSNRRVTSKEYCSGIQNQENQYPFSLSFWAKIIGKEDEAWILLRWSMQTLMAWVLNCNNVWRKVLLEASWWKPVASSAFSIQATWIKPTVPMKLLQLDFFLCLFHLYSCKSKRTERECPTQDQVHGLCRNYRRIFRSFPLA